jgi:hypothetical protein
MFRATPLTKGPTVLSNGKNENKGLTEEEYERKYSSASTASFNEATGIENDNNNNDYTYSNPLNNARPGIYTPGAGSKASNLIPHIGNVRQLNYVTREKRKNDAKAKRDEDFAHIMKLVNDIHAKHYAEVERPRLNALTARKASTARHNFSPVPTQTARHRTRKNRNKRNSRRASRRRH